MDNSGAINLGKDYHTGPMVTNIAGDTAYITVTTRAGKGSLKDVTTTSEKHLYIRRLELMIAVKKGSRWGHFTRFPYDNVAQYSIGHAAFQKTAK